MDQDYTVDHASWDCSVPVTCSCGAKHLVMDVTICPCGRKYTLVAYIRASVATQKEIADEERGRQRRAEWQRNYDLTHKR